MKKVRDWILSAAFFFSSSAFAQEVTSYQDFASALRAGERFLFVIDMQECTGNAGMPLGYFSPNKLLLMTEKGENSERIVTSDLHFTNYPGNAIYEYTKYTFKSDDTISIRTVVYDPVSFKPIGKDYEIHAKLNQGIKVYTQRD